MRSNFTAIVWKKIIKILIYYRTSLLRGPRSISVMSINKLEASHSMWDAWGKWKNMITWQTFTSLANKTLKWTQVIQNYYIDIGEGPNARDENSTWNSDHKKRKTSLMHKPNKDLTQNPTNTGLWKGTEFRPMCFPLKTKKQEQKSSV